MEEFEARLFIFATDQGLSLYVEEKLRLCGREILAMSGKGLLHCAIKGYNRQFYDRGTYYVPRSSRPLEDFSPNPMTSLRFDDVPTVFQGRRPTVDPRRFDVRQEQFRTTFPSQLLDHQMYDRTKELYDKPVPFCMRHRV